MMITRLDFGPACDAKDPGGPDAQKDQQGAEGDEVSEGRRKHRGSKDLHEPQEEPSNECTANLANAPDDRGRQTPGKLLMATHAIADNKASRLGSSRRLFQG